MNEIVLVPLTKSEYKMAKIGSTIKKKFRINGNDCCVVISDRFMTHNDIQSILKAGFDTYSIDIHELKWSDIDRKAKYNMVAECSNGLFIALVSQNIYHQFQKERDK